MTPPVVRRGRLVMHPATSAGSLTRDHTARCRVLVAPVEELWTLPASLHRLVLATQEAGNVTGHITSERPAPGTSLGAKLASRRNRTWKWSQNHGGSHLRRAPQYETREPGSKTEPGSAQQSHVGTHATRLDDRQPNQVREFRTPAAQFETTSWLSLASFSARSSPAVAVDELTPGPLSLLHPRSGTRARPRCSCARTARVAEFRARTVYRRRP